MSIRISVGRGFGGARGVALSSTLLASLMLAACEGPGVVINPGDNPLPLDRPNTAPTANAGTDPAPQLPTDTVTLTGTATDDGLPTGSKLSYTWEFVNGPTGPGNTPGASVATSNEQARGLLISRSVTPSLASHAAIAAFVTICSLAGGTAAAGLRSTGTLTERSQV